MTFARIMFCSVLMVLALLRTVDGQEDPKITREIWPEIKRVGMTAYLNCTVTRQSNNKVQWIQQSTELVLTSDDRIEIDNPINEMVDGYTKYDIQKRHIGDMTTYMLIIRRLVLTDAGTYTCQINLKGADFYHPSKDGVIVVLIPPTIVQGVTTQTINVNEGQNVTLSCAATGYPTPNISWVRVNGQTLPPPYNRYAVRGNKLTLYRIKPEDRGMYRCVADNNVRPLATYDTTVFVFFRPRARAVQKSYGQAQNRQFDITFECIVAGYPAPALKWYHIMQGESELKPLDDGERHKINQLLSHGQVLSISEVWFQIKILNVQANDYGVYICEGSNELGSDTLEIIIYETSECQGANCPPEGGFIRAGVDHVTVTSLTMMVSMLSATVLIFRM